MAKMSVPAGSDSPVIECYAKIKQNRVGHDIRCVQLYSYCFKLFLWQIKRLDQEHCHLRPRDRTLRAICASSTTSRNAFCHQLLDPGGCPVIRRHVPKASTGTCVRRSISCTILGTQQENRHLSACGRRFRAVIATATAACDALGCQLLDPGGSPVGGGHVPKASTGPYRRRIVGRTMDSAFEEDCHLGTSHSLFRAVPQWRSPTATCDPCGIQSSNMILRPKVIGHIRKRFWQG